jgi:subtilisin-like proprotein convertase family protein
MNGKHRTGTWTLRVRDTTRGAVGWIDSWTVTVA